MGTNSHLLDRPRVLAALDVIHELVAQHTLLYGSTHDDQVLVLHGCAQISYGWMCDTLWSDDGTWLHEVLPGRLGWHRASTGFIHVPYCTPNIIINPCEYFHRVASTLLGAGIVVSDEPETVYWYRD